MDIMTNTEVQNLQDKAIKYLKGEYHCSEAVLKALAEHYDIDSELLIRSANPFGGGIGDSDSLCGAVSGAIMAIGAIITPEEREAPSWPAGEVAKNFMQQFNESVKSTNCKEIRHDLPWDKAHQYCDEAVREAVRIAYTLIEERFSGTNPT